jgi:hypothetical protein
MMMNTDTLPSMSARKMINKQIGVSLIALTLVVVSLFNASTTTTNVYADSYTMHKDNKEGKGLRVIIDLVKEDINDHVRYDSHNDGEFYYRDVYDPERQAYKVIVGKGVCWDEYAYGSSDIYEIYYDKQVEYIFDKGVVKVGQPFYVYIENLENQHNVCYDGYNHKGKHPEYVTAFLPI